MDQDDYELVAAFRWTATTNRQSLTTYASRSIRYGPRSEGKSKKILMHRLIMGDEIQLVDHKNRNGLNNTRWNLRAATRRGNAINAVKVRIGKTSKYRGVSYDKTRGKWRSQINDRGKKCFIGYFESEELAAVAYNHEAMMRHGEFAITNEM